MKTKEKRRSKFTSRVSRTAMSWVNPKTMNVIGYQRAHYLHLDLRSDIKCDILNPKTRRLISIARARKVGLIT